MKADAAPSHSQKPPKQDPNNRHQKPSVELLVRAVQAIAFGYPPEVKGQSLLLKTLCASETGPRDP